MNLSRISRRVQLLGLLQAGKGSNVDSLATACGVSRRTIFRDLDVLRQAGVPRVFHEEQGSYRIPGAYFLPPTDFTADEALAVMVLCYEFGSDQRLPFYEAAHSAALKLESRLPGRVRDHLHELTAAVQIKPQPGNRQEGHQPVYCQLLDCIAVRIGYESFSEAKAIRLNLCPYRLLYSRRSWYVIGRSSLHREVRTFNVGRIQDLTLFDETFHLPRGFSIARYLRNAWHLIPELGPDADIVVRFGFKVAGNVAEIVWHKTQRLVRHEDGSLDFYVRVSGLNEISQWILGYGDEAEVLKPAALRELVADKVRRMAKRYDSDLVQAGN